MLALSILSSFRGLRENTAFPRQNRPFFVFTLFCKKKTVFNFKAKNGRFAPAYAAEYERPRRVGAFRGQLRLFRARRIVCGFVGLHSRRSLAPKNIFLLPLTSRSSLRSSRWKNFAPEETRFAGTLLEKRLAGRLAEPLKGNFL